MLNALLDKTPLILNILGRGRCSEDAKLLMVGSQPLIQFLEMQLEFILIISILTLGDSHVVCIKDLYPLDPPYSLWLCEVGDNHVRVVGS